MPIPMSCQLCGNQFFRKPSHVKRSKFCSKECCNKAKLVPLEVRLRRNAIIGNENECWEHTGAKNSTGYGWFGLNGRHTLAHIVAYIVWIGPVSSGQKVLHSCDNRICINPRHLWTGTAHDNSIDMVNKGRHPRIKLRPSDIPHIWEMKSKKKVYEIARVFHVSPSTISNIYAGRIWRHISPTIPLIVLFFLMF